MNAPLRRLRDLADRYDALSLRERSLIAVAVVGLIALIWHTVLMSPLERERRGREQRVAALRVETEQLAKAAEELEQRGHQDPDRATREAIDALGREIAAADGQLRDLTAGLIEPREMARVLEQILARKTELRLIALRSLPGQPLLAAEPGATAPPQVQIYKHGVELELEGGYLPALRFLQALQALPWRFFWERLEYQVPEHPRGRLRMTLYTLSLQEGWIGV